MLWVTIHYHLFEKIAYGHLDVGYVNWPIRGHDLCRSAWNWWKGILMTIATFTALVLPMQRITNNFSWELGLICKLWKPSEIFFRLNLSFNCRFFLKVATALKCYVSTKSWWTFCSLIATVTALFCPYIAWSWSREVNGKTSETGCKREWWLQHNKSMECNASSGIVLIQQLEGQFLRELIPY